MYSENLLLSTSSALIAPKEEKIYKSSGERSLTISIPKDRYCDEKRVALTPAGVKALVAEGHQVIIEKDAGKAASLLDKDYIESGAKIVSTPEEAFNCGDIIITTNHPLVAQIEQIKEGKVLLTSVVSGEITAETMKALMRRKVTAIGREFIDSHIGKSPVINALLPMEGKLAVLLAAEYVNSLNGGQGILLGGVAGIRPAELLIVGAGTTTEYVVELAIALGASVKIFGQNMEGLSRVIQRISNPLHTCLIHSSDLADAMKTADAVVCTIDIKWNNFAFSFEEEMLKGMKKGAVVIDTVLDVPPHFGEMSQYKPNKYLLDNYGILYYGATNISSRVAHSASFVLNDIHTPIVMRICKEESLVNLLRKEVGMNIGVYVYKGVVTNELVERRFGIKSRNVNMLLTDF